MSYLDDPRVFFAAERTLLAWQRTAISLIGLGFVVERFGLFIRSLNPNLPVNPAHMGPSLFFGVLFLVIAALVALLSAWQFKRFLKELSEQEIPRGHVIWPGPIINIILAVAALAMATWFVVTS